VCCISNTMCVMVFRINQADFGKTPPSSLGYQGAIVGSSFQLIRTQHPLMFLRGCFGLHALGFRGYLAGLLIGTIRTKFSHTLSGLFRGAWLIV
jgi:hypothetical protein